MWATPEDVEAYWPDGRDEIGDDEVLDKLLASAQVQCQAYAPTLPEDVEAPANYVHAVVMQARALFRSGIAGSGDGIGADGMTVTVFPMDWTVKNLLRPKKGRPRVG